MLSVYPNFGSSCLHQGSLRNLILNPQKDLRGISLMVEVNQAGFCDFLELP